MCRSAACGAGSATPSRCGSRRNSAMAEPLPLCHLNGMLLPLREARISPLDRSFLFGDGAYEVILVRHGRARQIEDNLARLTRSLRELKIRNPHDEPQWRHLIE